MLIEERSDHFPKDRDRQKDAGKPDVKNLAKELKMKKKELKMNMNKPDNITFAFT